MEDMLMDAKYFREKAELCLRLADGDLADDFLERAKELDARKVKEESIRHEAA
jgi:phage shock protein A